ncbi:NADAR family protein [Zoogloea sp.]|uniref:NADAR family protein n=1 Tax=Zoogloea sp. TaxID=49181 RepID=UPI00261A52CF|nr:NADAR family protein [Zoogloea sp.]MDD3353878.1 NADAR family protein [Zoogloea sp.]
MLPELRLVDAEFTDRGPADPDVFAAKRESARRQGKEFFVGTTPGKKVGGHGRDDTRATTPSMLGNMTERQALHRQLLNEEGGAKAEAIKEEARMNIGILADIWLKQGIDERIVSEVSQNVAPAQREAAVAIMSWVARGFKGADGEVLVPESLIKSYGKDAPKLIDNAYTLAAKQGLIDTTSTDDAHQHVMKEVTALTDRYGTDADVVFDAMTPIAQAKFTEALSSNSRKEYLSKIEPIAKALRTIANGGEISKAQDEALDSWFGPRKNEVLDHFYEEKTQPKQGVDDGQDDEEVISGLAEDNAFAQREEQGLSESTEHGFTKVKEESYYQHRDKGAKEAGEYFDLTNEEHRVALDELKAGRVRAAKEEGDEPSLRTISTVGFVDREIEKRQHQKAVDQAGKRKAVREYARSLGKDEGGLSSEELTFAKSLPAAELTPSERRAAEAESKALHPNEIGKIRREIAERELGMKAPKAPGKDASEFQRKFHEMDLRDHDRAVDSALAKLNKDRVAVRVTKSEMPNDLGFTRQDVTDLQMKSLDLSRFNALVDRGVLVFDNGSKSGNYYATTARKIISLVVRKAGDAGFTGSFNEPGNLVRLYRMLQDGVTSIMEVRGFTRVGYIDKTAPSRKDVKPVWMKAGKGNQNFPDVLPLTAKMKVGDARAQQKAYDAEQERQSVVERAILQSSGKAMQFLMAKRLRSFMLSDKDYARLGKGDSKAKANHDVASKALADFHDAGDEAVLKQALKAITGSGELHYTPREAGMMLQLARHMLTPKQVSYLRGLKNDLGRKPSDNRFITARDATLKFFDKDQRFEGLKKGTEDAVDWRERALSAINWKLNTAKRAEAAASVFNETGNLDDVTDALYHITGDEQYNKTTTPSENSRGVGPDDDIQKWGTLRDDPAKAVGTKGTAIHRNERGMAKGDDDYATGMMAGAGDSTRLAKDSVTGVREVKTGVQGRSEPAAATVKAETPRVDFVTATLRLGEAEVQRDADGTESFVRPIKADGVEVGRIAYTKKGGVLTEINALDLNAAASAPENGIDYRVVERLLKGQNGDVQVHGITDETRGFWSDFGADANGVIAPRSVVARQAGESRPVRVAAVSKRSEAAAAGTGVAPGVRPVQGGDSVAPVRSMPMNFADGTVYGGITHAMRPEFKGKSTIDLIQSGDRKATTRATNPEVSVGQELDMTGKDGTKVRVRVTKAPYQLKLFGDVRDQANAEKWSKLEGWSPEVFAHYAEKGAWQFQYERVRVNGEAERTDSVNIWHATGENAELSNLAARPVELNGRRYLSVEHAYQSWKSGAFDQQTYDKYTSAGVKIAGNKGTKTEGNWNIKLMERIMQRSFEQNQSAREALLATGNARLTHTQDKGVWAKEFPRILMEIRDSLLKRSKTKADVLVTEHPASGYRECTQHTKR